MKAAGSERVATLAPSGGVQYYHPDHLGSSSVITDGTGATVQALTYFPYGATRTNSSSSTPAVDVPYKYTGQELDTSTSLYDYEARSYDPVLGRFISADTIVPDPSNPQDLNRYSYVRNNSINYSDPTGHNSVRDCLFVTVCDIFSYPPIPLPPPSQPPLHVPPIIVTAPPMPPPTPAPPFLIGVFPPPSLGNIPQLHLPSFQKFGEGRPATASQPSYTGIPPIVINTLFPFFGLAESIASVIVGHDPYTLEPLSPLDYAFIAGTMGRPNASLLPKEIRSHLENMLRPGGKLIGEAGSSDNIRILQGNIKTAEDLTLDLGKIGQIRNHPNDPTGVVIDLPGGGYIGLRESKKYGPTIDINVPGFEDIRKIHFQ